MASKKKLEIAIMDGWYECRYDTYESVDYNITFLKNFSLMPKGSGILGKSQLNAGQVIR